MAPLIALIVVTALARLAGALKLDRGWFQTLPAALCAGVAALFLLTGGAHFIGLREDPQMPMPIENDALVISDNADIYGTVRDLWDRRWGS